jgi:hypothetical protein
MPIAAAWDGDRGGMGCRHGGTGRRSGQVCSTSSNPTRTASRASPECDRHGGPARTLLSLEMLRVLAATLVSALAACGFRSPDPAAGSDSGSGSGVDSGAVDAPDAPRPLCDPADPTLRACYTFDGNTEDGSSNGYDAVATGTSFGAGRTGQGLVVGAGDSVVVAGGAGLNVAQLTIDLWIRPSSIPAAGTRAGLVDSGNRFRMFLQPAGLVRCATTNGPSLETTAAHAVSAGAWAHLTCTYDGTTMQIYVDGAVAAMLTQASTIPTGAGMVIGQNNPSGENFDGTIDELRIFGAVVPP